MRKVIFLMLLLGSAVAGAAELTVRSVDLLRPLNLQVNGAGPVLVQIDTLRHRLVAANTLSSSITLNDLHTWQVVNIPLAGRALQHLKAEAMTIDARTGAIALIGDRAFHIVDPVSQSAKSFYTDVQFESIAFDEATGHLFLAGRESRAVMMFNRKSGIPVRIPWQETEERLTNLNQTPPPPLRKVIADPGAGQIVAVDGISGRIALLRGRDGKLLRNFEVPLQHGGRWHLAGFDRARHILYLVIETAARKVIEAARIDVQSGACQVIELPGYTEGAGINCLPGREEIYIPYDNHPSVHVVDFAAGQVAEIQVPNFGNDATALDPGRGLLYVASWAKGELDVIDLHKRVMIKRITDLGILPHMFCMAFDPHERILYYSKGATAVNGAFGAAITLLDPAGGHTAKLYTGWAPIAMCEWPGGDGFAVFNNEDSYLHILPDGSFTSHHLPCDYPVCALTATTGQIYLSYGPHQSYWPNVYIWGARDGLLTLDPATGEPYDRRIPRQALRMALDRNGALYLTQNAWGKEEQFIGVLPDPVRDWEIGTRLLTGDSIERETTPRLLVYDPGKNWLYSVKAGEKDEDPGLLHIFDLATRQRVGRIEVGRSPADLAFDDSLIYIANFGSASVTIVHKNSLTAHTLATAAQPLRFGQLAGRLYLLSHGGRRLQRVSPQGIENLLRLEELPGQLMVWRGELVIATHDAATLYLYHYHPDTGLFGLLHMAQYPYGDTRYDSGNTAFYLQGQFGDALFDLLEGKVDRDGRLWIRDFLAGRVLILEEK
ncbi:MAG TPA: hypothetical protein PL181_14900 [bacterium]|nr:hypothetical protein [bacterium]